MTNGASATTTWAARATVGGALPPAASVLAVTVRPGQESAELGGTLLAFRRAGANLSLLCLTRGEAIAPDSGSGRLEAVRPWEVQMAASILGIREVAVANYRDGELARHAPGDLTARIHRAVCAYRPDLLLVTAPEVGDRDDGVVARGAIAAGIRVGLPVLARTRPGVAGAWTVPLGDQAELSRAIQRSAVAAHVSQGELLPSVLSRPDLWRDSVPLRWLLLPGCTPAQPGRGLVSV